MMPVELSCLLDMLQRGSLSSTRVATVARQRKSARTRIGKLALRAGMLTVRQIFTIVEQQSFTERPFGETAVALGFMTQDDVDCIIALQVAETSLELELFPPPRRADDEADSQRGVVASEGSRV
jgi:hypothetical protein